MGLLLDILQSECQIIVTTKQPLERAMNLQVALTIAQVVQVPTFEYKLGTFLISFSLTPELPLFSRSVKYAVVYLLYLITRYFRFYACPKEHEEALR